ncbi:HAMP domain-containing protein, partial [candidate division GN15 bacterium]|nr:HAMP domain-containing protein [candidate division GN15 bacterium]
MFKNLKIGRKLALGFGVVLLLLSAVSVSTYLNLGDINAQSAQSEQAYTNQSFLIAKEVDHLQWMSQVSDLFVHDDINSLTVETDPHKCGLGKWMHSEETARMKAEDPVLAELLDKMEEPHARLHETAVRINETYVNFDMNLQTALAQRWSEHLQWINDLANANQNREVFEGTLDPHQCAFGKWYYGFTTEDPELASLLESMEEPHARLHQSAEAIVAAQRAGNWSRAAELYSQNTIPALTDLEKHFEQVHAWIDNAAAQRKEALAIFRNDTKAAVEQVQGHLEHLVEHYQAKSANAAEQSHAAINSSIMLIVVLGAIAILIGLGAAFVITRGITGPVSKIANVADGVAVGEVDHEIDIESKDEIGMLAESFRRLIAYMKELAGHAQSIADNDLTVEVEPKSEQDVLGNSFKTMVNNLTDMIGQLGQNATELVSAANEIASTSEQMSRGASDQTQQVNQISTAVEEMTATIVESSRNAGDASEGSKGAAETAEQG